MDKTPVKYSSALIDSIYLLAACRFLSSFQTRLSCDGWEWISWPHTLAGKMPLKVNKKRTREEHQIVMFHIWERFTGRQWLIYLAVSISVSHKTVKMTFLFPSSCFLILFSWISVVRMRLHEQIPVQKVVIFIPYERISHFLFIWW